MLRALGAPKWFTPNVVAGVPTTLDKTMRRRPIFKVPVSACSLVAEMYTSSLSLCKRVVAGVWLSDVVTGRTKIAGEVCKLNVQRWTGLISIVSVNRKECRRRRRALILSLLDEFMIVMNWSTEGSCLRYWCGGALA